MTVEKVIDLGAFRAKVRRGGRWEKGHCDHLHVVVNADAGTIECSDCGKSVSAFHVVLGWCERWSKIAEAVQTQKLRAAEIFRTVRNYKPRLRAIQAIEKSWWRSNYFPMCPHCHRGLAPEDFADGAAGTVSREYEMARRARGAAAKKDQP